MIRDKIRQLLQGVIHEVVGLSAAAPDFSIEVPENPEHGDYATNAVMIFAKTVKKPPMEIAQLVASKLEGGLFEKVEAAEPGFINFWIKDDFLLKALGNVLKNPGGWGKSDVGKGKTAVVEYFQLNIAKRPHVGHLRSAVIGDAIKRMLKMFGYKAVSDTHVGDWGTQFGLLLLEYKKLSPGRAKLFISDTSTSAKIYADTSAHIAEKPEERERAKEEFAKLERGDPESRGIWKQLVATSMKELEKSRERLGLLPFDEHRGESAYEKAMPGIVELALKKGIAKKLDDRAVVVDLSGEGLDEAVLIKSDGASTYLLRDLATIQYRKKEHKFWKNLYVVDVRQSHHFKQVFRVAELLGFEGVGESQHVEFGFMSSPEGALSTRKGTAISLDAVLDEAKKRALDVIHEKNPDLSNPDVVAEAVGLGALKYFDLSHHRKSDVVFRWDQALSFEGDTGPYLQYTHARLKSILRKLGKNPGAPKNAELDLLEHRLLVSILRLPEAVEDALKDFTPNILANYLHLLAQTANEFYHSHPVTQEDDPEKKNLRAALVYGAAVTLARGLNLLGIEAPEEM